MENQPFGDDVEANIPDGYEEKPDQDLPEDKTERFKIFLTHQIKLATDLFQGLSEEKRAQVEEKCREELGSNSSEDNLIMYYFTSEGYSTSYRNMIDCLGEAYRLPTDKISEVTVDDLIKFHGDHNDLHQEAA